MTAQSTSQPSATSRQRASLRVQAIASELEEDIAMGLLHPRERLVEDALMERFDAKRHVVRSALTALESRGAVEKRAHVGALVRSFTAQEVRDLYEVRELLEVACAKAIQMPVSSSRLAPIEEAMREHAAAVTRRDRRSALRANLAFHERLFGLAPNRLLVDDLRRHALMASPIRSLTVVNDNLLERARDEHEAMVEALRDGDTTQFMRLCALHLEPSRDAYLSLLEPDADVRKMPNG
ncbi:GntR family transcriptional regulator [Streptomyces sp. NPDC050546]|uniref:GntR family transcriptional regulator n=1 Tax=Streptomyces sp. NPDC050546 TaxID=3365628 RepID=UPI0037ACCCCD